jgi:hypothetical protein
MSWRVRFVCVLGLAPLLLAGTCWETEVEDPDEGNGLALGLVQVLSPGEVVEESAFEVEVRVRAPAWAFDPASDVTLNGMPLPLSARGPVHTAGVVPGEPLRDDNVLRVRVRHEQTGRVETRVHRFAYAPPGKARLFRMGEGDLLTGGPLVHNRAGDYRLENGAAIFVVQDVAQRDLYSVGGFGGNLIDAVLKSDPTADNFLEFQAMLNIETVVNAQTATILNDGQNGLAAVLETCGPDDLLDFVNPSSQLLGTPFTFPAGTNDTNQPIEGCTRYTLEPGFDAFVTVETEVFNTGAAPLRLFVGDWMNGGGELEQWVTPGGGLGAALFDQLDTLAFVGFGENTGVDYQYVSLPLPPPLDNRPSNFFSTSGVTVILHHISILDALLGAQSPFLIGAGQSRSYRRVFGVGNGSGSNAIDLADRLRGGTSGQLSGCVSVAGEPSEGAKVSVVTRDAAGAVQDVVNSFRTAAGPCPNFSGTLPVLPAGSPLSYAAAAAREGSPYENGTGDPEPVFKPLAVDPNVPASVEFDLPAPGRLCVAVFDESGAPLPARVTVVGFDPSPEPKIPGFSLLGFSGEDLGLFNDVSDDEPFGIVVAAYADASGQVAFDVEPGDYGVAVSRGTEYSLFTTDVSVAPGPCAGEIQARLTRVIDSPGFVSSDFHVHGIRSADSRITDRKRVLAFAAEGIENPVMTDHHVHTDLRPAIAAMGLSGFLTATIGEEITTFDYGHFNGYPYAIDPTRPSGGSTDWANPPAAFPQPAPGADFPSLGSYNQTPQEILVSARTQPTATAATTVQINHIGSHFDPLRIDTGRVPPASPPFDPLRGERRLSLFPPNLFAHFPALELWNGYDRNQQLEEFLDDRIGIWFNHLNQGLLTTAIADTDTHRFVNLRTAGARSWTASPSDAPWEIDPADVAGSVDAGRAVGGQGLYVQTRLLTSEGAADLTWSGSTEIGDDDGNVVLEIHVQSPSWAQWDEVRVYANADSVPTTTRRVGTQNFNTLFRAAAPQAHLVEGDCDPATKGDGDFDVTEVADVNGVAGAGRLEATLSVPFSVAEDTWFAVLVSGRDGFCEPMFPVYPADLDETSNATLADLLDGNRGEDGVMALGFTNALYLDLDGGGFQGKRE